MSDIGGLPLNVRAEIEMYLALRRRCREMVYMIDERLRIISMLYNINIPLE